MDPDKMIRQDGLHVANLLFGGDGAALNPVNLNVISQTLNVE